MVAYRAPLDDIRFVLHELFDYSGDVATLPGYEEATPDLVDALLEEAARFCENELLPLNASGDAEGCSFENGVVRTPKGFKEAYRTFAEGGWTGLACDPEYGGQGLPMVLQVVLEELICSTNLSFGTYHQERDDVDDLDERVDCRPSSILVRIADCVAGDRSLVGI